MAHGMPRLDVLRALDAPAAYRSGFWGIARVAAARRARAVRAGPARAARGRRRAGGRARRGSRSRRRSSAVAAGVARGRDLHGGPRAAARALPAPGRLDPRADARRLALHRLRRLLAPGALRGDAGGSSTAIRASSSRARRAGSASTATSSARSRSPRPARATSRWPTRTTSGSPASSRPCWSGSGTRGWSTATRGSSGPTASCWPDTYWSRRAQQPRRPALAAGGQRGHGRGIAVPARPARRRAPVPAGAVRPLPRPLDRTLRAGARRDPVRRPAAVRLRPARPGGARPRRREPDARAGRADRRAAARPARAGAAVAHALLRGRLPADPVRDRSCSCAAATG